MLRRFAPILESHSIFGELSGNERFAAAKREAEAWAALVEAGGAVKASVETVADACRAYAESRPEADQRFKRYVYGQPLAKVKLDSNDHRVVAAALGTIARARGATGLARAAGVSRAALYNSLSPDGNPTLATLMALLDQMGLRLRIERQAA